MRGRKWTPNFAGIISFWSIGYDLGNPFSAVLNRPTIVQTHKQYFVAEQTKNQRTNGPVNAHLISWPIKAQNIQKLENIWKRNNLDLQYSHTFIISISCLHLPTFRSQAALFSEKSTVFTFSHRKA